MPCLSLGCRYDDLKDDLIKDFSRVEDKLGLRKGEVSGSSLVPGSYSERAERRKKAPSGAQAKSAGGLIDLANQTKRRQSTAIDAERQRQDDLFQKRLAERRKKNQL